MNNQVQKRPEKAQTSTNTYIIAYNGACFVLWTILTGQALLIVPPLVLHDKLFALKEALWPLHSIAQGLALLEVLHAAAGIVRASPFTTAMQVASRILVVFGILYLFPEVVVTKNIFNRDQAAPNHGPLAFTLLIFAHGVTEVIRYGFFVYREGISQKVPGWLVWLRYNTFFVLYPLGISSECWLIYRALGPASRSDMPRYELFLKTILFIYIPGSYILYTHMMTQRRKVLKGKGKSKQL